MYSLILALILISVLMIGMYYSYYSNLNERLAYKKRQFRVGHRLRRSPQIKSKVSYSLGTIICLLIVFAIFNQPQVDNPFTVLSDLYELDNVVNERLYVDSNRSNLTSVYKLLEEVREVPNNMAYVENQDALYFAHQEKLIKVSIDGKEVSQESVLSRSFSHPFLSIAGLIDYNKRIVVYGLIMNDESLEGVQDSIIYILEKENLEIYKRINVRGKIEKIDIVKDKLFIQTSNQLSRESKNLSKIASFQMDEEDRVYTSLDKIYYIENNMISNAVGLITINLKNNKYDIETYLLPQYYSEYYKGGLYLSFNYLDKDNSLEAHSYILKYNIKKGAIVKVNKLIGNVYDDIIIDGNGGVSLVTLKFEDDKSLYRVYKFDEHLYYHSPKEITETENKVYKMTEHGNYYIDKESHEIEIFGEKFKVVSGDVSINEVVEFDKKINDNIVRFQVKDSKIDFLKFDLTTSSYKSEHLLDAKNHTIEEIEFYQYRIDGSYSNYIRVVSKGAEDYRYDVIPFIDNDFVWERARSFKCDGVPPLMSYYYINKYFFVVISSEGVVFIDDSEDADVSVALDW